MSNHQTDIAIVGAGMVGASLALACAETGWRVAVIEPTAPAAPDPDSEPELRVSALSAGSEAWLRELGVWKTMADHRTAPSRGCPSGKRLQVRCGSYPVAAGWPTEPAPPSRHSAWGAPTWVISWKTGLRVMHSGST